MSKWWMFNTGYLESDRNELNYQNYLLENENKENRYSNHSMKNVKRFYYSNEFYEALKRVKLNVIEKLPDYLYEHIISFYPTIDIKLVSKLFLHFYKKIEAQNAKKIYKFVEKKKFFKDSFKYYIEDFEKKESLEERIEMIDTFFSGLNSYIGLFTFLIDYGCIKRLEKIDHLGKLKEIKECYSGYYRKEIVKYYDIIKCVEKERTIKVYDAFGKFKKIYPIACVFINFLKKKFIVRTIMRQDRYFEEIKFERNTAKNDENTPSYMEKDMNALKFANTDYVIDSSLKDIKYEKLHEVNTLNKLLYLSLYYKVKEIDLIINMKYEKLNYEDYNFQFSKRKYYKFEKFYKINQTTLYICKTFVLWFYLKNIKFVLDKNDYFLNKENYTDIEANLENVESIVKYRIENDENELNVVYIKSFLNRLILFQLNKKIKYIENKKLKNDESELKSLSFLKDLKERLCRSISNVKAY